MIKYFNKRFKGIEQTLQQPSNKNSKTEETFKFKRKWNNLKYEFNEQILRIIQNLLSMVKNDDASEANYLFE